MKWAQEIITDYLLKQKARVLNKEIEPGSLNGLKKPIKLLLEMNDVTEINWKKTSRMLPSGRRYALDREPTQMVTVGGLASARIPNLHAQDDTAPSKTV